jgi:hypothetical protein
MSANGVTDVKELTRASTEARAAAEPAKAPMVAQYATGFEGASMAPFSPEAAAVLGAPVPEDEVEIREDGIVYLPGVAYRRILTRAFGVGAWALLPRGPARTMGDLVVYHGALYILGRFVSEAVGECQTRLGMSYASSLEGARTDCLTRCCKDLGVATELWDPTWREAWQAKYADKKWAEPKEPGKKGRWAWSLKPKADTFALPTGRNAAPAPKGEVAPKAGADLPQPMTPTVNETGSADTGEAADEDTITGIRNAVRDLGWKGAQAKRWLAGAFGVDTPTALTARQAADALQLLVAAQVDDGDATYNDVRTLLAVAGRVKAP